MNYTPSRYVQKTLLPDERCVTDGRFSFLYTLHAWWLMLLCILFGYGVHYALYNYLGHYTRQPILAGGVVGFFLLASMLMKMWTTEILLTTERLIYKRGFFSVKVVEVDIEQLASDSVDQSLWGRLFDYGVIHIRCIEADDIDLPAITKPYEFRNALEQQKHLYREKYMKGERLRQHGMKPEDR